MIISEMVRDRRAISIAFSEYADMNYILRLLAELVLKVLRTAAGRLDAKRNMQPIGEFGEFTPASIAAWRSYFAKCHTSMPVAHCKSVLWLLRSFARVAIEKKKTLCFNFLFGILSSEKMS